MSVTFWCPEAPTRKAQPYPEEDPEFWIEEPVEGFYEMNLSNTNARDLLKLLGVPVDHEDLYGEWTDTEVSHYLGVAKTLKMTKAMHLLIKETVQDGNTTFCGRTEEYVEKRFTQLIQLLESAQRHKMKVRYG